MADAALRVQVDAAFASAISQLPAEGPLAGFRAALVKLRGSQAERLRVALVGRAGSGKSRLANALLGENLLVTGDTGVTRTVTWLRHAPDPELTIHYEDGSTEQATPEALAELTTGGPSAQRHPAAIEYLVLGHPSPCLTGLDLIDTPGLGAVTAPRFVSQAGADALVLVIARGAAEEDENLLRDFQRTGLSAEMASPLNSIGVLTVESLDSDDQDVMANGLRLAGQLMNDAGASRLLHDVRPVASLVATAAQTFSAQDFADLALLARQVDPDVLTERAASGQDFGADEHADMPVPGDRRRRLFDKFSGYGIALACQALREHDDEEALRRELLERSGMTAFSKLLADQFASRAELIKLHGLIVRVAALAGELRDDPGVRLTAWDYATLDHAVSLFKKQADAAWDRLSVVSDCYARKLRLGERDMTDALRILGELGRLVSQRLGMKATAPAADLAACAMAKKEHWARLDSFPFNGDTKNACRVVLRACEELVAETRQA
jgi:hypothetical protein